jgi:hypothetical protein
VNTLVLARPSPLQRGAAAIAHATREVFARERRLAAFGALLLVLLVPLAFGWAFDARELRGANVWIKPMKFALSIAVLALTTAWFIGHLLPARRRGRAVGRIVWLLIGAGSFEFGYITLQAALGAGSHYNVGDALHGLMYTLMGIGALALTATQPMLAWQLARHADAARRPALVRQAVVWGLTLTFVLGAGAGIALSALQPPDAGGAASLPVLGWPLAGGDLRPAHFIGIHAGQVLPLAGWWLARRDAPARSLLAVTLGYSMLFAAAMAWGLAGRF